MPQVILLIPESLSLLVVFSTLWPLLPRDEWWIRGFDFPRLQILSVGIICLILLLVLPAHWDKWRAVVILMLIAAVAYQLKMVLPYTPVWPKQVKTTTEQQPSQQISVLVSNVLTSNHKHYLLLEQIKQHQPDIVLTLESDLVWEQALSPIEPEYPYIVRVPLDNLYGMHLYSRLPLQETEIKFLLSEEVPSIHTNVTLKSGKKVRLYCLHPKPPSPTEAAESTLRDAELLIVGRHIEQQQQSCIVMGDLNDVAWSRTTRLFQRISGLLDPRVGRHFFNTFHADYPLLRWSLDHIFHGSDFTLIEMKRLPHIGSDHFPVLTRLQYTPGIQNEQPPLEADMSDYQEAAEKIEQGIEKAEKNIIDDEIVKQSSNQTLS
ncbi:endonuclease/exonuclease/phosphatase family protein [Alkanindiges sp. WGS2144]|uniref:endonuclease/exonuclease/phosphatase family protein n=1 Tax=Alkanindiges sp. WGS2144 TaxID=3366808 RepID=UPI0037537E92